MRPIRILTLLALLGAPALAQDAPSGGTKGPAKMTARPPHVESGRTYQGREIAQVMTYLGADWLIRPEREEEERPEAMLDALKIKPGDTVADVGAGVGYTSVRISK